MKSERKMKQLKSAAWDTDFAYRAALLSHKADWETYIAADIVLTAARKAAQQAAEAANAYEAEDE